MEDQDFFARLEKHELECRLRYERIEDILQEQKAVVTSLDNKLWGLAVLVLVTPIVTNILL